LQTTKSSGPLDTPPSLRRPLLRDGRFCDLVHDLVKIVVRLVDDRLRPHAEELGSEAELAGIDDILEKGNGAHRQAVVYEANHDLHEVMHEIAEASIPE